MDPTPQSSFIPKQAMAAQRNDGVGLVFVLALVIFLLSLFAAGATFGYQKLLESQLAVKSDNLDKSEAAFEPKTIQELGRLDSRLVQTKTLLQRHISPSQIFAFLSTITLERVQLTGLEYTLAADGAATLAISGIADDYSSVALQSDQFGSSKVLHNVIFSGVVANDVGKVTFNVAATLDAPYILYRNNLATQ